MTSENDFGKVIIYGDKREQHTELFRILENRCDLRPKQLTLADYQLSERVAVERKRVPDFLQSIIDGRLFQQITDLKANFSHPVLLIEGEEDIYNERNMSERAINGALSSIVVDMQMPIIWTRNQLESAYLLMAMAHREQFMLKKSVSIRIKPKSNDINKDQQYLVAGLPNVSTVLAKRLLKKFGSPEKVFAADDENLRKVDGVGKILAGRIKKVLSRKYK